jgi:hypothetical protein
MDINVSISEGPASSSSLTSPKLPNKGNPDSISANMQPRLHISTDVVYSELPKRISGAV